MRKQVLIILLFCFPIIAMQSTNPVKVIITAGQSNTDGRILNTDLPAYIAELPGQEYQYCKWNLGSTTATVRGTLVPFWPAIRNDDNPSRWAYDAVTYYWLEKALKEDFYVIKWSHGGTAIDTSAVSTNKYYWNADPNWLARNTSTATGGKSLLLSFEESISAAIDSTLSKLDRNYEIVAFLWHQGESDRNTGDHYYLNLKMMLNHIRSFLVEKTGNSNYRSLPFIYGTVSRKNKQYSEMVEKAMYQLAAEDKNCYVIDMSEGELQKDQLHFTRKSVEFLGIKMYNVLVDLGVTGTEGQKIDEIY